MLLSDGPGYGSTPVMGYEDGFVMSESRDELHYILTEVGEEIVRDIRRSFCLVVASQVH